MKHLLAGIMTLLLSAVVARADGAQRCADPNGDGQTTATDALLVLQQAVGSRECGQLRFVVIPDTQHAVELENGQLESQIDWLLMEQPTFVAQVGDIVQLGDNVRQWQYASQHFGRLDGIVPYGLAVGNHDQDPVEDPSPGSTDRYLEYFGPDRFAGRPEYVSFFDGGDSHASIVADGQLLLVFIEFGAAGTSDVLTWAHALIASHPEAVVAVVSHHITNPEGTSLSIDGQAIFAALGDLDNLAFVFGGHVHTGQLIPPFAGCIEHRRKIGNLWIIVHNCQSDGAGGSGWLRDYRLDTVARTLTAETYSPWLDQSDTDSESEFTIEY